MREPITIHKEEDNHSKWIKVYIPEWAGLTSRASIQNSEGVVLKRMTLIIGLNAIDISHIPGNPINIKVETSFETILKEINTH
ncbi:MAG: hypothetical protein NTW29_15870 [Bacteroidetes bacterium]|nr:hypothetical protein [Bacteroidota bacterium]